LLKFRFVFVEHFLV